MDKSEVDGTGKITDEHELCVCFVSCYFEHVLSLSYSQYELYCPQYLMNVQGRETDVDIDYLFGSCLPI